MLLVLISFVAGILTVLAPCVLALLPIIVGGSLSGGKQQKSRPYIIAIALAASLITFTLLLKVSTIFINLSPNVLTDASGGIIIALGLVSIFPAAWERLLIRTGLQSKSQRLLGAGTKSRGKYLGPILIGVALGPVFSSCSPTYAFILASILPKNLAAGIIYIIAYSLGLVITLLLVSLAGRRLIMRLSWAVDTHSWFRRAIGVLFVLVGLAIITGWDITSETWVDNHLPFNESRIEQLLLSGNKQLAPKITGPNASVLNVQPTPAPRLQGLTSWINSPPLQLSQLKGKVVLVDFWTYSCINCIRSLPYVEKWYTTYQSKGFVVIGVHTPEFAFEHVAANVQKAVTADHITYPVALDNNYDTWNAFSNDSWPADYLIDQSGNIRYVSLGEGDYNTTERAIQALLGLNARLQTPTSNVPISQNQTPETYFGTNRTQGYVGTPDLNDGAASFKAAGSLQSGQWTLGGSWQENPEYITSEGANSTLTFHVTAKDVYMVAGSSKAETVSVGLPAGASGQYGSDAPGGQAVINGSRLYHIVSLNSSGDTTVTLTVPKGVSLYTFTFGS